MKTRRLNVFVLLMSIALLVFLLSVGSVPATAQGLGTTERVSVASDGTQGNRGSVEPSISADGRYVAFSSLANNLVSNDTNNWSDIFVHDRVTGQTTRVSVASDGTQGNRDSWSPSISADGRYVAFYSYASNLVSNDTNDYCSLPTHCADVFVHDRVTGQTTRVSVASDGTQGNSRSDFPSISADGRYVAFESVASNLVGNDTNNKDDIFVHDRVTGQTTRVSIASDGTQGNDLSSYSSISGDGRYVAFSSNANNLVSNDTNNIGDTFVHDRMTGQTTRVSVASDGSQGNRGSFEPFISANGRYISFNSRSTNLVSNDANLATDIFVHDRVTGQTTRVSVASDGTEGNSDSVYRQSISADGRYVAFGSSASNLVGNDTNNKDDIFVHDRVTAQTTRVSIASDGTQGNGLNDFSSISGDGRYVAFYSDATNLVSGDTNDIGDVFVRDREGRIMPTVSVEDESSNLVSGAEVYRNGTLAGTTSVTGTLVISELQAGDRLVARQRVAEFATAKDNHNQDASQNWAWRVYITSLDIPATGEPRPYIVNVPAITQTLTLKKDNALIGFNIVASVEWDANTSYLEELRQGFERASAYLYDAMDGQMLFERVTIYDNAQFWADADYQVRASNQQGPKTFPDAGGILVSGNWHIFLGRYWDTRSANQGSWTNRIGLCTPIHEFGHYALNLYDSYYYYDANGKKTSSYCTSEAIKTNLADHINATLMYWPYNASEFSMRGVNGLWSAQCEQTHQWQKNGESDWETIKKVFADNDVPERWTLKTPVDRGTVVAGPSTIPLAVTAWSTATIGNNANTGICASPPEYTVTNGLTMPLEGVRVDLEKNGRVIYQGQTGADGRISVLGAADGDTVSFTQELFPGLIWIGSTQVSCVSGQSLQLAQSTQVVLDPAPFTLSASVIPDGAANQVRVIVQASTNLKVAPQVHLYQSGAVTPIIATMTYDAGTDEYSGMATLDNGLPSSGIIKISATDTNDQSVQIFTSFRLTQVDNTLDTTIRSNDGQVELYMPAGSLSSDGRVSVFPDATPEAFSDDLVRLSGPYRIQPEAGLGLVRNSGLTFRYLDTGGSLRKANLATAQIYRWDEVSTQWMPLSTSLLTDYHEASANINSFGIYVLMAERLDTTYLPVILKNK